MVGVLAVVVVVKVVGGLVVVLVLVLDLCLLNDVCLRRLWCWWCLPSSLCADPPSLPAWCPCVAVLAVDFVPNSKALPAGGPPPIPAFQCDVWPVLSTGTEVGRLQPLHGTHSHPTPSPAPG